MELYYSIPNTKYSNNEIRRIKYNIFWVPFIAIIKYFFWNYENIYFLFLSLFQLSTLYFLPAEWSPTGPYSTAVPFLICIFAEIITGMISWCNDWLIDHRENNQYYEYLTENCKLRKIKNKDIYPGMILHLIK